MAYFYRENRLQIGTPTKFKDVADLTGAHASPVYLYDLDDVRDRLDALRTTLGSIPNTIHYALKANSHPAILKLLSSMGAGADTVSAGEIRIALDNGFTPDKIIFSGVGKTKTEIEFALKTEIKQINVESPQELSRIHEIAKSLGTQAQVAFRLNPDVDAKTHPYITTGFRENKFGMDDSFFPELIEILRANPATLRLRGLTMHIGSQILDLGVIREAMIKTVSAYRHLNDQGFRLDRLDIGGGLGVDYGTDDTRREFQTITDYGQAVREILDSSGLLQPGFELLTEPGRILVARSGVLIGQVQYVKRAPAKTFAILDTGMHHLLRPSLYGAKHRVLPLHKHSSHESSYDIVGPICESSDFLAKDVTLGDVKQDDLLALADAGAYGFSMANTYNAHALPAQIAVSIKALE